ncbi:MAG: DegT/DnrJ/EryC1/StrS family aminotransferase [archaeon]
MKLAIEGGKPLLKPYSFEVKPQNDEINSVIRTLRKGYLTSFEGKHTVLEFEKRFAEYHSISYAVACNTGTASIHSAIAAMNAVEGGEVLVPAYTFITGVTPMLIEGLQPVFVDIDLETLGMDHRLARGVVSDNTVGIIPTHLYGFPCAIQALKKLAQKSNTFLIEDCCQAHGARVGKKVVGTFGDAGCFSFYLFKNITTGEGGMTITSSGKVYEGLKTMRQCGKSNSDSKEYDRLGFNYRMTDFCAAIGLPQLKKLDSNNKKRLENAKVYEKCFKKLGFQTIPIKENTTPVYFKYPILLPNEIAAKRDYFAQALRAENVSMPLYNTIPLPKVKFLRETARKKKFAQKFWEEEFPVSDEVDRRLVAFFTHSLIPKQKIHEFCEAVEKVVNYGNW